MKRKAILLSCALSLVMSATFAQKIKVKGSVTDDKGNKLSGVTITEKGTSNATATNPSGGFELNAETGKTLIFNIVGYEPKEVVYTGGDLNISLNSSNTALDEVVVVAFGTQKKANLTGSVATITPKQLADRPVTSLQNALQGISPGITVLSRPGEVGKSSSGTSSNTGSITVRGRTNLGSPSPMFIIDGIPATSAEFSALSPNDINSMSVLKDAASASLYGSRAANGVILVTTKRGGGDRAVIGFNANYGFQSATYLPEYADAVGYAELYNKAMVNAGKAPTFKQDVIDKFKNQTDPDYYPNNDWYKEVLRGSAPQRDFGLNVNAPGKITNYYLGLNYFDQQSLVPGRKQDRINMKLNTNTTVIKDLLTFNTNVSFLKQDYDRNGSAISWVEMGRALPFTSIRQSDGSWGSISNGAANATIAKNNQLRAITEGGKGNNRDNYLQMAANASLTPLEGLSIDGAISLKYTNTNSFDFINRTDPVINFITKQPMASTVNAINELKEFWGKRQELMLQGTINYERRFGDHYAKATVGASEESNVYREAFLGRQNFVNNDASTIINGSSGEISKDDKGLANRTTQDEWALRSFFGRFNYSYKDKYLLEANVRMDYSSRFAPEIRKATFPSFSAGWNINKESFMEDVEWIDLLKLRGSYGTLGNQDAVAIGNYYNLLDRYSAYSFDGVAVDGLEQQYGANRLALWEKVTMSNVGLDATFLGGKFNLVADYFVKKSDDVLLRPATLSTSGFDKDHTPFYNQGTTQNKGIEIALTYNGKIGEEFTYSVSGNISKIKNTILSLGDVNEITEGYYINRVGGSVGDYYGYKSDGLFTNPEELKAVNYEAMGGTPKLGDIKYVDINGDNKIDAEDRTILGNDVPWFNYGFNFRAAYKNFDLDVLTYGVGGVKTYLDNEASFPFFNGANIKKNWANGWSEENNVADAPFPRITLTGDAPHNYKTSDFWLFSGNYFRIRAITVGYTFPKEMLSNIKMSQLRFFASSNNPFTIMADKRLGDFDPETGSGRASYPGVKTISVGLTAKF
ncbi:SusC/RagA family TonB-linked outer membrane protein [Sphingobacterium faecium NBRC 15299]|uniref:SusC/RagA family TonB-linked outer membrane protein n=1 Tax=Sphingobacterium faecium TaxID=34087 RepID=UPI000D38AA15|nr:TonB-dependent receptor [Sphingobacterium faecium]MQP27451.1 SusC/RagA family TonB-linked outer membrane protein [Sphingobacterium faecium]PTX12902.1 TonB-linked SusC/RagA family outer membrane protein [Sphingobacterium faecium]GEM65746.1 SusC/RagA family TonB-linked outer membrane protein [Sphingobacterium faecium NBRC 15299]